MSDAGFVAAAYAVVLGGLAVYAVSIARRVRTARRLGGAIRSAAERDDEQARAARVAPPGPAGPPADIRQ